jgi:hypothetical protein
MSCFDIIKEKITPKHHLTPKNIVTASFNTKKYLSIVYYREIYEISWILTGYHLKSENRLIRDDTEKNIIQAR